MNARRFAAQHAGTCKLCPIAFPDLADPAVRRAANPYGWLPGNDGFGRIKEGQLIQRDPQYGYVHAECADQMQMYANQMRGQAVEAGNG